MSGFPGAPGVPGAPAAVVRVEGPDDRAAVHRLVAAAFGQEDEALLVEALRADPCWLPGLSLVAVAADPEATAGTAGGVVGHVLLTRMSVGGAPALALAPLAVDPQWQRRGVGSELVRVALARASADGERLVVVLGDPDFYARFGFRPAADLGVTGPYDAAGPAFQALALPGAADGLVPSGWAAYPGPLRPQAPPGVALRPARVDDAAAIAGVLRAVGWFSALAGLTDEELVATVRGQLAHLVPAPSTTTVVAEAADATIVGYANVHWLNDLFLPAPEGYLSELFLVPAARGQGLGGQFLDLIVAEARSRGAHRLMLINGRHRESYQRGFYAKHGWEERDVMANFVYWVD